MTTKGFVLGKFMPPHQGHVYMCEFARNYCDELTILVCTQPGEPMDGALRYQWMKELFPDCNVRWFAETVQQEPNGLEDATFWRTWQTIVQNYCPEPDFLFASEDYGHQLAATVRAAFVPVDISRTARAVSGTAIRENPFENWQYIPHVVRPYFTRRVTLFGPESSGKSTLAQILARHYDTVVAPEYGRTYTETLGTSITADDLRKICRGHIASVAAAKRQANKILIEDTDPVMTALWSDMLLGSRDPWFDSFRDHADLYLLCDVDIPWEDDGTRYFETQADRQRFFDLCEKELLTRGVNYVKVSGTLRQRTLTAVKAIDEILIHS